MAELFLDASQRRRDIRDPRLALEKMLKMLDEALLPAADGMFAAGHGWFEAEV